MASSETDLNDFLYFLFEMFPDLTGAESLPAEHSAGRDWLCPARPVPPQPSAGPTHQTQQLVANVTS